MNYIITDINLNEDTPTCKTPDEIVSCIMSICNKVLPNMQPDLTGFEKMDDYQIAYGLSKVMYSQMYEEANRATEEECKRIGLITDTEEALDQWSDIDSKHDQEYAVNKFMYLKYQAEKMMVENAFSVIEADANIRKQLAKDRATFDLIRAQWERPIVRQKVVDMAFKLRV